MLLSYSKDDLHDCLSSYQDYLRAKGEMESFIISLVNCQQKSLERSSESSFAFQESFENRLNNTFLSNWDENEQEFIEDFALHFIIKKEHLISNNSQNLKKDSNEKFIKKKKNLISNSTVFIILRKYKNKKLRKTKATLKKKLLKINNDFIKNNIPKKVYRKRKIVFYKSFLFTLYFLKNFYAVLKLIISKFLFFIKNFKIKIIFPNRRKSDEYISNIIKLGNKKIFTNINKGRKKIKKFLINDFKEFIKVIIFGNIIVNIIMIIIIIKVDNFILLLNNYFFYNQFRQCLL